MNMLNHPNVLVVQPAFAVTEQEEKTAHMNMDTSSEVEKIPFHSLKLWNGNVRQTGSQELIAELAASIDAVGLLSPLIVMNGSSDSYLLIAGRRRYLALQELIKQGKLTGDTLIACNIVSNHSDATEISLVENVMQLPMHPADKYEAFQRLADNGLSVSDIAVRFGIAENIVHRLLKLGRVSPEVMAAFRAERIDYAQVQAFTISDYAEEQNEVLKHVLQQSWRAQPHYIREQLVKDDLPATDKRVQFVGLDFYEMCGGAVRRDLFDEKNSGYVQEVALLNNLVETKAEGHIAELKAEGWQWVEFMPDPDWQFKQQFARLSPEEREFTETELEEYTPLVEKFQAYEDEGYDEEDETITQEINILDARIQAMHESLYSWTAELKSASGVLLSLERDGTLKTEYGLVRKGAANSITTHTISKTDSTTNYGELQPKNKQKPEYSASLHRDLTAYRTAALRIELARNTQIALTATVHSLMMRVFYSTREKGKCVKISGDQHSLLHEQEESIASIVALKTACKQWAVPANADNLWDWCIARTQEELLQLLALCTAHSVDAVYQTAVPTNESRHADQLAAALQLDMRKWFMPTAENCFGRISRNQILAAYREVTGEELSNGILDLKKKDLAVRAEREIADKWLPSLLRSPEPVTSEVEKETA